MIFMYSRSFALSGNVFCVAGLLPQRSHTWGLSSQVTKWTFSWSSDITLLCYCHPGRPDITSDRQRKLSVTDMHDATKEPTTSDLLKNSTLYREFQAEREEILKHKWIESEKAGHDIGFERALTDWIVRHRSKWRKARQGSH